MSDWLEDALADRRRRDLYRVRRRIESAQGGRIRLHGREVVNFGSNDYLGLAGDPRLARAAAAAARRYGTGSGASPLVSGYLPPLRALEREVARWEGTESALVFSSGFAANLGVVAALAGPADAIFSDILNHASLIDGCRLSGAAVHVYRHRDMAHLQELLHMHGSQARRRLILSDGVFSMDGDAAPVAELLALAERTDALLLLDEAHATGVLGSRGRGASDDLPDGSPVERLVKVGTLSKALGSQGGFVCGSRRLISYLVNTARPYVFSTALSPPAAAAARQAIRIVQSEPERRNRLLQRAEALRQRLQSAGSTLGPSCSPIIPLIVGAPAAAVELSRQLLREGLLVPAIRPPSVPEGTARLRISLTASHTDADVDGLVAALLRLWPPVEPRLA
jgi:8-amino-7-oxononanoate synthase